MKARELGLTNINIDWSEFENISDFLKRYHSSINFSILNGDALNGYGRSEIYSVWIDVYKETCRNCYLSDWSNFVPIIECNRHSWKKGYERLTICSSMLDFKEALQRLDENLKKIRKEVNK